MFQITGPAYDLISRAIEKGKKMDDEQLYVRLSIGIG